MDDETTGKALATEIRTFMTSYGEHDPECPGIDANAWADQSAVCTCGFSPRLDELTARLEIALTAPRD